MLPGARVVKLWLYIIMGLSVAEPVSASIPREIEEKQKNSVGYKEVGAPFITNYRATQYKASSQNWIAVQDLRGVMYFGNSAGVLEFDGTSWRLIPISNQSIVRCLALDRDGTIYVGAIGEIGYLAADEKGKMHYVSLLEKIPKADRTFGDIFFVYATLRGVYFIGRESIFIWHEGKLDVLRFDVIKMHHAYHVYDQVYIRNANIKDNPTLYRLRGRDLEPVALPKILLEQRIWELLPYRENKLLMVTSEGKLYVFDPIMAKEKPEMLQSEQVCKRMHSEVEPYLKANYAYMGAKIHNGHYYFNTRQGGIIVMHEAGKLVRVINKNRGLQDDCVWNVFVDRDENLWASTNNGIDYIEISSPLSVFGSAAGLDSVVLSYLRADDRLYVSNFSGVYRLSDYVLRVKNDILGFAPVTDVPRVDIFALTKHNARVYAFPNQAGVYRIDQHKARRVSKVSFPLVMSAGRTKKFPNHLFLGLQALGLAALELHPETGEVEKIYYNSGNFNTLKDTVQFIYSDERGDLWLAAYSGIFQVHFKGENVDDFELIQHKRDDLKINNLSLHSLDGQIVVATGKGLYKLMPTGDGPTSYNFTPAESIHAARVENHAKIEMIYASGNDIIVAMSGEKIVMLRKHPDGDYRWDEKSLIKVEGAMHKAFIEPDGVIWLGTSEGLMRYGPEVEKNHSARFQALIRSVASGENNLVFEGTHFDPSYVQDHTYPRASLMQPENLAPQFEYEGNDLSFTFTSTFYERVDASLYSYRLEGFDDAFSDWRTQKKREYTNLPEGAYRFVVKAKNIFGMESQPAYFRFSIAPPWYRTMLAYISYGLVFLIVMYGGIRVNSRRLVAAKRKLEKIVAERTREVREKNSQLEIKNQEISRAYDDLETTHRRLKDTQNQLLDASWKAGMADVASNVLHNVGNALNSVHIAQNNFQDRLKRSRIENLDKSSALLKKTEDIETKTEQGSLLIRYISKLSMLLNREHLSNLREIQKLGEGLARINAIVAAQQRFIQSNGCRELLPLEEIVKQAIDMSKLSGDDVIEVRVDLQSKDELAVERHKVIQILINLLNNAARALTRSDRTDMLIQVTTRVAKDDCVQIEVTDNGIGLDAESLESIFSFEIGDEYQGTYLDLHASANAAKSMDGSLTAASAGPNMGSTFVLTLPRRPSDEGVK